MAEDKYTFDADTRVNKTQAKWQLHQRKAARRNIMNYKPKKKRKGRYCWLT